jgi:hypothetical protein
MLPILVGTLLCCGQPYAAGNDRDMLLFAGATLASGIGGVAALVGLAGVRANGAALTLPAVGLGLLLNGVLGLACLSFWVLCRHPM